MSNPNVPPGRSRLLIVDFDQPDAIASLPLGETYSVVESGFLNIPGSGYYYSLTRGEMEPPRQVDFAVRLSASDFELKPISAKLLRYRESSGLAGFETEEFMVGYAADTGLVTTGRLSDGTTQLLPPIPTDIRPNGRWVRIGARNRFMSAPVQKSP